MIDSEVQTLLEKAFSPSSPIKEADFFIGRLDELDEVVDSINERGLHVCVYGERGVGKTSLSENVATKLHNLYPVKVTCNRSDNFKLLWDKAFQKVRFEKSHEGVGYVPEIRTEVQQLDLFLPEKDEITSLDVQMVLEKVQTNLLFIFDEYDTVEDPEVMSRMADTLKSLSDNATYVTVMLVGVGDSVSKLVGEHSSIERCLRQVKMPRMSGNELRQILDAGARHLKMSFAKEVVDRIIKFSLGFAHFTHLLGKLTAKAALEDGVMEAQTKHLDSAIKVSVRRVDESIRIAYQKATITSKSDSKWREVVWACAIAKEDEYASFKLNDVACAMSKVVGRTVKPVSINYHMGKLASSDRGCLLEKLGTGTNVRYRFKNPLLKAYVLIEKESLLN